MLNFDFTRIDLIGIIDTISEITSQPIIMTPCGFLRKLIDSRDNFEVFDFCCRKVDSWYSENLQYLIDNDYPSNEMAHHKNLQTLSKIINDIDTHKEEYRKHMTPDVTPDKLTDKKEKLSLNSMNEVFIVHGRNEGIVESVARFLQDLNLKPIILHEQVSNGNTLIEKIEKYTNVGYAIAIYSPCDVGALSTERENLKERARQNVVFEHGYLLAKLGRENVCALIVGDVETPTDISGLIYIDCDDQKSWRYKIGKELRGSGYTVDFNNL